MAMPLPVAARKGAEDSVIQGHLKEARTYLPQRAIVKMENVDAQNQGARARLPHMRQPKAPAC